jgi:hypothetical protein
MTNVELARKRPAMPGEKRQKQRAGRGFSYPALNLKSNLDENGCIQIKCAGVAFIIKS